MPFLHSMSLSALKPKQQFLAKMENSIREESMVKLLMNFVPTSTSTVSTTLSQEADKSLVALLMTNELKSLSLRPVMIKNDLKIQCLFTYKTNVITKNYKPTMKEDGQLYQLMNAAMKKSKFAKLETFDEKIELASKRGGGKIRITHNRSRGEGSENRNLSHDRQKNFILDPKEPFLSQLGITSPEGKPLSRMSDKYRQIQKFTEIITSLVEKGVSNIDQIYDNQKSLRIRLTDMGSGLGYLTFAAHTSLIKSYDYCSSIGINLYSAHEPYCLSLSIRPFSFPNHFFRMNTGIESRKTLVDRTNEIARSLDSRFDTLKFIDMPIEDFMKNHENSTYLDFNDDENEGDVRHFDILVALHACDTATDDAIYYGIKNNADIILTSPCCHKQIRKQLDVFASKSKKNDRTSDDMDCSISLLEYGIFRERLSEMITDQIRATLLSLAGYDTNVSEFIASQHTAKNIM